MTTTLSLEPGSFRPAFPFHMVWLATNACTARCLHCSSNSARRSPDELNTAEACDLFDQFANVGVVDLAISGGEPLLRKDLFDIISHARSVGLSVGVGSNGAKITPDMAKRLAGSGINRLQISMDGLAHAHDHLRCWPGLHRRVLTSIDNTLNAGLCTHICCTVNQLNIDHLKEFTEFVATLGIRRLNFSRYVPTGRGDDNLDLCDTDWHRAVFLCNSLRERYHGYLQIVTHLAQEILVDSEIADMPGFIGCQAGVGQGCVTANGTVLPCVLLPLPLGNVREQTFREIWSNSPVLYRLRNRSNLQGQCGSCQVKNRCGGCRAVAYAKTGNYMASDPRCWLDVTPDSMSRTIIHEEIYNG